jgi:hypothetical protein
MEFKVGETHKCPEDHEAKIVWISEDKNVIAVKCPKRHFSKMKKVPDPREPTLSRRSRTKEKKIFVRNMVFLIRI